MRTLSILLILSVPAAAKVNVTSLAAWTTIAVNSGTILKWSRHPKREAKKTAKHPADVDALTANLIRC